MSKLDPTLPPPMNRHTRVASVHLFVEADAGTTAHVHTADPGRAWVNLGPLALHGTFGDLERALHGALVAVRGLQAPTTVAEFLECCVRDCVEGR